MTIVTTKYIITTGFVTNGTETIKAVSVAKGLSNRETIICETDADGARALDATFVKGEWGERTDARAVVTDPFMVRVMNG